MKINNLAIAVYNKAIREEIEEKISSKYLKRIEYLVGANNELMQELEQYEALCEAWKNDML
jgi:hypothetical protein